jgi:hypothetical protein
MSATPSINNLRDALRFAALALEKRIASGAQLFEALSAMRRDQWATPLGELLCRQGVMDADERAALEQQLLRRPFWIGGDAFDRLKDVLSWMEDEDSSRGSFSLVEELLDDVRRDSLAPSTAPPSRQPTDETPPGPKTSRYHPLCLHARGGLGEVFVARDEELGREVALKQIREQFADFPDCRARFVREAQVTAHLEHPGIVPVYGLGTYADGRPYYAMRFIRGESLHDAIARFHHADQGGRDPGERNLTLRGLLERFVAVCDAVAYAHARGVIHRDLKPANVMLGEYGETLVVDWGLTRHGADTGGFPSGLDRDSRQETEWGQVMGTPAFMPPEQALGQQDKVGPRSDVYSLGATLYQLLTGKAPVQADTVAGVLDKVVRGERVPARQANPRVPRALEAVCEKAMAVRPSDRYESAKVLAEQVQRWLADEPVPGDAVTVRLLRWSRRHPAFLSWGVTAGLVMLLGTILGLSLTVGDVRRETIQTASALVRAEEGRSKEQDRAITAEAALARSRIAENRTQEILQAARRARAGDYLSAAEQVASQVAQGGLAGETLYDLAWIQAVNAHHAARDATRPLPEREKRAEGYAKNALSLLERAAERGYFRDPRAAEQLDKDDALSVLRGRDDYRAFRKTLQPAKE